MKSLSVKSVLSRVLILAVLIGFSPTGVQSADKINDSRFRDKVEHPLTARLIAKAEGQKGNSAPTFEWQDATGKTINSKTLSATKPMLVYFIEKECPCSRDAAVFINQLQTAYGNSLNVVGVVNASAEVATEWVKITDAKFPVVADVDLAIIDAFKAERSASTVLVAPGGVITQSNPGYNAQILGDLSNKIAGYSRRPFVILNFKSAPEKLTSGCPLH